MSIKYYPIKSYVNDLYLEVDNESPIPGKLVKGNNKNGLDGQMWCDGPSGTNSIRSKLNEELCLDFNKDGLLVINNYQSVTKVKDQHWNRAAVVKIINDIENLALQINGIEAGSTVIKAPVDPKPNPSQAWHYSPITLSSP